MLAVSSGHLPCDSHGSAQGSVGLVLCGPDALPVSVLQVILQVLHSFSLLPWLIIRRQQASEQQRLLCAVFIFSVGFLQDTVHVSKLTVSSSMIILFWLILIFLFWLVILSFLILMSEKR